MTTQRIIAGDCMTGLRTLPDASVHCCVTSPPYWGLRDYGHDGQIGLESTPEAYVARIVEVFREVRRVLREDGTLWLNLGDSYAGGGGFAPDAPCNVARREMIADGDCKQGAFNLSQRQHTRNKSGGIKPQGVIKPKDLVGIPWRVAFALQADGWWLRQDIIWHKPNPMPESVRDRCTKAHEYVFLLTKSERYFYDAAAVSEKAAHQGRVQTGYKRPNKQAMSVGPMARGEDGFNHQFAEPDRVWCDGTTRNRRSVWTVTTKPYSGAHFAVMPPDLVEPCIKAGCPEGGTVLDPFAGSGTTLAVAAELGRSGIGCELNPEYIGLAERRIKEARASVALFEGAVA
jgi:DNA modification methylase